MCKTSLDFQFSDDSISSSASASYATSGPGSANLSASSTLNGATLFFQGSSVTLPTDPDPNTQLSDVDNGLFAGSGLTAVLNEQSQSDDSVSVNALDVSLDDFNIGSATLNGNLTLGHSEASLDVNAAGGGGETGGGGTLAVGVPPGLAMLVFMTISVLGFGFVTARRSKMGRGEQSMPSGAV